MTAPSCLELRDQRTPLAETPAGLWPIPGGWCRRSWQIRDRKIELVLPAVPDAFLDDPAVHAAFDRDEYMPYWAFLWPASLTCATQILSQPFPTGSTVLELGCGVGLVGLVAALAGYDVVTTDYEPQSVDLAVYNATQSGCTNLRGQVLDWRSPTPERYSVIIGCELLYEDRNHAPLLHVLDLMLAPGGVAWLVDGGRAKAERFVMLALAQGWQVRITDSREQEVTKPLIGLFQRFELSRSLRV